MVLADGVSVTKTRCSPTRPFHKPTLEGSKKTAVVLKCEECPPRPTPNVSRSLQRREIHRNLAVYRVVRDNFPGFMGAVFAPTPVWRCQDGEGQSQAYGCRHVFYSLQSVDLLPFHWLLKGADRFVQDSRLPLDISGQLSCPFAAVKTEQTPAAPVGRRAPMTNDRLAPSQASCNDKAELHLRTVCLPDHRETVVMTLFVRE